MTPSLLLALAAPVLGIALGLTLAEAAAPRLMPAPRYVVAASIALALGLVIAAWLLLS